MEKDNTKPLSPDEQFLLDDLSECFTHSSWDWPADERFAAHLGLDISAISATMQSCAPSSLRVGVSQSWDKLTQRRLRLLRGLVRKGLVHSSWAGTGYGGVSEFGLNRCRHYQIINKGEC